MQQLQKASKSTKCAQQAASAVLETVPKVMLNIRKWMRASRGRDLSITQFRALAIVDCQGGMTLRDLADHIGLTMPATSRLVQLMVDLGFMEREENAEDRRRVSLSLTSQGSAQVRTARAFTEKKLAEAFGSLSDEQCSQLVHAMQSILPVLDSGND